MRMDDPKVPDDGSRDALQRSWTRRELIRYIRERRDGVVRLRDLTHAGPRYATVGLARAALDMLAHAGVGRWRYEPVGPKGGRPVQVFVLNGKRGGDVRPGVSELRWRLSGVWRSDFWRDWLGMELTDLIEEYLRERPELTLETVEAALLGCAIAIQDAREAAAEHRQEQERSIRSSGKSAKKSVEQATAT